MAVTPERFRSVLGCLAGGVTVVTSRHPDGTPSGLTATAVCSVSLAPPLVLACLGVETNTHRAVEGSGAYGLNLLACDDAELAIRFGREGPDKFRGVRTFADVTGSPLLEVALGYCDCVVAKALPAGDHTIFVGRVEGAALLRDAAAVPPLVYHRGRYGTLGPG